MSTRRLEAFADGVFAIAATLLILNVDAQVGEGSGSPQASASAARMRSMTSALTSLRQSPSMTATSMTITSSS